MTVLGTTGIIKTKSKSFKSWENNHKGKMM